MKTITCNSSRSVKRHLFSRAKSKYCSSRKFKNLNMKKTPSTSPKPFLGSKSRQSCLQKVKLSRPQMISQYSWMPLWTYNLSKVHPNQLKMKLALTWQVAILYKVLLYIPRRQLMPTKNRQLTAITKHIITMSWHTANRLQYLALMVMLMLRAPQMMETTVATKKAKPREKSLIWKKNKKMTTTATVQTTTQMDRLEKVLLNKFHRRRNNGKRHSERAKAVEKVGVAQGQVHRVEVDLEVAAAQVVEEMSTLRLRREIRRFHQWNQSRQKTL